MGLEGKHALALGCTVTEGAFLANQLAQWGALVTCAGHHGPALQSLAQTITEAGGKALAARYEAKDQGSVKRTLTRARGFRPLDLILFYTEPQEECLALPAKPGFDLVYLLSLCGDLFTDQVCGRCIWVTTSPRGELEHTALGQYYAGWAADIVRAGHAAHHLRVQTVESRETQDALLYLCAAHMGQARRHILDLRPDSLLQKDAKHGRA